MASPASRPRPAPPSPPVAATAARADGRWAAARLARRVAARGRDGWRAVPAPVRRRWAWTVATGLVLCLAASAALARWGEQVAAAGLLDGERALLLRLDAGLLPLSYHSAIWLGAFGGSAMLVPLVAAAAALLALHGRPLRALSVLLAFAGAKPIVLLGWSVWARARPDFIAEGLAVPASLHAFPSGHVLQATAVYALLTRLWTERSRSAAERALAWALLAAFLVVNAVARLRLGAHWPSDVAAGLVLGAAWAGVLAWALHAAGRGGARRSALGARRVP